MENMQSWARGSSQKWCFYYVLRASAGAAVATGILLWLVSVLETFGYAQDVFPSHLALWFYAAGFTFSPITTVSGMLILLGLALWLSAQYRLVLNVTTLALLMSTCLAASVASTVNLLSAGRLEEDLVRLWTITPTPAVCAIQETLHCSGIVHNCNVKEELNNTLPAKKYYYLRKTKVIELEAEDLFRLECREECVYSNSKFNKTCEAGIVRDTYLVLFPFSVGSFLVLASLSVICSMCCKPLGLAFVSTTCLLLFISYLFSYWRWLWRPTQREIANAQRVVAASANFIAVQLSVVSIAGLHWKNELSNEVKRSITFILAIVPVFGVASSFALILPYTEEFFSTLREVYCTLLLWKLVTVWQHTAETTPLIHVGADSVRLAENRRHRQHQQIKWLIGVKVICFDLNSYFFGGFYPSWVVSLMLLVSIVLFSVILYLIHEVFSHLRSLRETGEGQFFSIKAIVSFVFFDFAVLKLLDFEGVQSVMVGELYIAVALVGLSSFQLYTWIISPLGSSVTVIQSKKSEDFSPSINMMGGDPGLELSKSATMYLRE
eukprot:TRINITY_DN22208_c0_g3_i1.p1 TRINITY_DN22208_c0_g3~~TRINITY_DN22208_c0_g3_i1.p1  ORF type:complete len:550 (+),score=53.55 TRINITY_DN22208_c0_g3_i1:160-1809(+)